MAPISQHVSNFIDEYRSFGADKRSFIELKINEIRSEVGSKTASIAQNGMLKLIFLYLSGYDISWSTIGTVSLIGNQKLGCKAAGYLAASLSIQSNKELINLLVNTIKKDMHSTNPHICGIAMEALVHVIDEDLASNISSEIATQMVNSKSFIRRRAVILMFHCVVKFPEILPVYKDRLIRLMKDSDPCVQNAACGIICELIEKLDASYNDILSILLAIFSYSANNWILIKVVKMMSVLNCFDAKSTKIIEQRLILFFSGTSAYSLVFECLKFASKCFHKNDKMMEICAQKIKAFLISDDPNILYLSLCVLNGLLNHRRNIVMTMKHDIIRLMQCQDNTIRLASMDLVSSLVNKGNLKSIVKLFIDQLLPENRRDNINREDFVDAVIKKIISICNQDNYSYIMNFEWYIDILLQLVVISVESTKNKSGALLATELLTISLRVHIMRSYLVTHLEKIIINMRGSSVLSLTTYSTMVGRIVWICCEFNEFLTDPFIFISALQRPWVCHLNNETRATIFHSLLKCSAYVLYSAIFKNDSNEFKELAFNCVDNLMAYYRLFIVSSSLQLQDRSCCYLSLLQYCLKMSSENEGVFEEMQTLFFPKLKHVSGDAQSKLNASLIIDLDSWINKDFEPKPTASEKRLENPPKSTPNRNVKKKKKQPKAAKPARPQMKEYPDQSYEIDPVDEVNISSSMNRLDLNQETQSLKKEDKSQSNTDSIFKGSEDKNIDEKKKIKLKITLNNWMDQKIKSRFSFSFEKTENVPLFTMEQFNKSLEQMKEITIMEKSECEILFKTIIDTKFSYFKINSREFPLIEFRCYSRSDPSNNQIYGSILKLLST